MLFFQIEVGSKVIDCYDGGVVERDGSGTSQDEVFGSLDAEAAQANDEHFEFDEFAHGLEAKGADLSGVEVSVDLDWFRFLHGNLWLN